jgi:heme/copper-type cytochrome/quinol oxidase subunit 3
MKARGEPRPNRKLVPNGVLAMLILAFAEVMFFAGLVSAFVIVKENAVGGVWPPLGQPRLPFEQTLINTAALLLSGALTVVAQRKFKKSAGKGKGASAPLMVAIVLGTFFVGFQGAEWLALLGQGLTLTSSTLGSFFYTIVGAHGLHAVAALCGLIWAWVRLRKGTLTGGQFGAVQVFWYFVVLLWPFIYLRVYL